jgi:hypothetical protein
MQGNLPSGCDRLRLSTTALLMAVSSTPRAHTGKKCQDQRHAFIYPSDGFAESSRTDQREPALMACVKVARARQSIL